MAASEVIDIDQGNDVIFICGAEPNKVKLRVSSAILIRTSPVFKALLSPRFKEGTNLLATSYVEIPLPDDSGSDMLTICNTLHHRNDVVPEKLDTTRILSVITLADKYDCKVAMKYVARTWIQQHLQVRESLVLNELLKATFYLNDNYLFNETCKSIVWQSKGPIGHVEADSELDWLRNVLDELNWQRKAVLDHISEFIDDRIEWFADSQCPEQECNFAKDMLCRFITRLSSMRVYGASDRKTRSIAQLDKALRRFHCTCTEMPWPKQCGSSECDNFEFHLNDQFNLEGLANELQSQIQIPCFVCVREGKARFGVGCNHE